MVLIVNPRNHAAKGVFVNTLVPLLSLRTEVEPWEIGADGGTSSLIAISGCLYRCEYEAVAAFFIDRSKEATQWMGIIAPEKFDEYSHYGAMVAVGLLSEHKTEDGWLYALTPLAIEQIYFNQN
jgi:hypothetical protein